MRDKIVYAISMGGLAVMIGIMLSTVFDIGDNGELLSIIGTQEQVIATYENVTEKNNDTIKTYVGIVDHQYRIIHSYEQITAKLRNEKDCVSIPIEKQYTVEAIGGK